MMRPSLLIAHPIVGTSGGGNVVAAWALEALREEFAVTLATLRPLDCEGLNRNFGTSLREGDCEVRVVPRRYQALLRSIPTQGALLEACVTARWARDLDKERKFDLLLSTQNEVDFGRPGLQYIHYPWAYLPRPEIELSWYHRVPGVLAAYRAVCGLLAQASKEGLRANLSLANSVFVAGRIKQVHGVEAVVLHPPVPGNFPAIPWEQRRSAAVAIGRLHPCKRWEMAVEIVDRARTMGFDLELTLIGHSHVQEYERRLRALAETRPWFRILTNLTREQLTREVAGHRYGLHTMEEEHFGIGAAEMLRAGCLPFVHDSGGPVEIVAGQRELRFRDAAGGAEKIAAVLRDPALCESVRAALAGQRQAYSTERFCESLLRMAKAALSSPPVPPQKS